MRPLQERPEPEEKPVTSTQNSQLIRVGHSPDPDDAFMFYALAKDKIPTGPYRFEHELVDIETLNRRAFAAELELTALSLHAYAHLADKYVLCTCGASMGDGYGPMVVTRTPREVDELAELTIAVPGTLTTAFLALRLCLQNEFRHVLVPFDEILDAVAAGQYQGRAVQAGLIIHEGQLTYGQQQLRLVIDLGRWWQDQTGLPLPLGANGIRRDLGPRVMRDVNQLLHQSIDYGLAHRDAALEYALQFGRGLDQKKADTFVGMYVNDWTRDFGTRGREAVQLLRRGHEAGVIPQLVAAEFVA
jgi:1,4-dihydroxy-6-naphthoate synthase